MLASRHDRKITLDAIEATTKIKRNFVKSIENERWDDLPDFPVVMGFVRVLADLYEVDADKAVALLRRDYPPRSVSINPKPDVEKRFVWSPRMTFVLAVAFVASVVFGYLVYQLYQYNQPPDLQVLSPASGQVVTVELIEVSGTTDPDASVVVNNQPVFVDESGNFASSLNVSEQTSQVEVISKLRSGRETKAVVPVVVQLE